MLHTVKGKAEDYIDNLTCSLLKQVNWSYPAETVLISDVMWCVRCSQMSHLLILAIPILICPNRGNSPHPRSLQKLPLQVFALFSFSLVPLSKHCSKSHFHMALAGSTTAPCSILTVLGIVFFIIRFLCKAQILIYKNLAAVNTISTLCHRFSC